jgi:hypothetical protein
MPPFVLQIIAILQLLAKAGPDLAALYEKARDWFTMLFKGGIITREQQQALMNWADAHEKAVLAGEVPPELQVEPDPE